MNVRLSLAALAMLMAGLSHAQDNNVPKGEVTKYVFDKSKIYPGTTRDFWVYVPTQYDGKTPACVHVNQDGIQFNAPKVFDQLIAEKAIPVTIGVFVMHGRAKAPRDNALDRFNRSYEYDTVGDSYARFLLEELLPEVEKKTTADGRKIVLSKSGNDRSIGGTSSGAICAFVAAWERPDQFSRVFSGIGTYVGLRGGHELSTLIRKFEPKPIRIFMEDGTNDLNIYAGDWWMANQMMQRSFQFAGYEHEYRWGDGPHNNAHATKLFPEGMKYLWKGWPEPVKTGAGGNNIRDLILPGEGWKLLGEGYKFTEGPAVNAEGEVFFNDVGASKGYKIGLDLSVKVHMEDNNGADGQRFGPNGKLYSACGKTKQIVAFDVAAKTSTVIAEGFKGNDLVVDRKGGVYVTDPFETPGNSKVYYISPQGEKKVVDTGLKFANGITLSPDQTLLYVADSRTHWVYSYQIQADGTLSHKQKYYDLHQHHMAEDTGADGLRTDMDGRLYVSTRMGIQVCDQPGRVNAILPTPNGKVANICFGGKNFDVLIACCGDKVYARKVKPKGCNHFADPIKPKTPGL